MSQLMKWVRPSRGVARSISLYLLVASVVCASRPACAGDPENAGAEHASFVQAVNWLRSDQQRQAVRSLETLARRGDSRAQFLLGAIHLEGKFVPQDKVQGYAWLHIVAEGHKGAYFRQGASEKARVLMVQAEPSMSGMELIQAEQISSKFRAAGDRAFVSAIELAAMALTGEQPIDISPLQFPATVWIKPRDQIAGSRELTQGCALEPSRKDCPAASPDSGANARCAGEIPRPDIFATAIGDGAVVPRLEYPLVARRAALEGVPIVLSHIDRSGLVCLSILVRSSGVAALDRAALDSISRARFLPAMQAATPVESLHLMAATYSLDGYSMTE